MRFYWVAIFLALFVFFGAFAVIQRNAEAYEASQYHHSATVCTTYTSPTAKAHPTFSTTATMQEAVSTVSSQPADDVELLAHLISGEATVFYNEEEECWEECSDDWQLYVACVALNRVDSPLFPDTLEEVIFQDGQYACTWDGNFQEEPSMRAYENAQRALAGDRPVPDDVLYQAQFVQGEVWQQIGNTYFCYI